MDLKICGILDIVILLGLIVALIVGYKKGFVKKVVSIIGIVAIIVFSIVYCTQFAGWMYDRGIIAPAIEAKVLGNVEEGIATKLGDAEPTVHNVLTIGLGMPSLFAGFVERSLGSVESVNVANAVAVGVTKVAMIGIAFLILVFGIILIIAIIKLIATLLRKNGLIRFVDGSLGALLYAALYSLIIMVVFAVIAIFWNQEWFSGAKQWLETDMGIRHVTEIVDGTEVDKIEKFHFIGLTRWIFNGNLLVNLFHLFW